MSISQFFSVITGMLLYYNIEIYGIQDGLQQNLLYSNSTKHMNSIVKSYLPKFKFSLYFLNGTDDRKLNFAQQLEMNQFVKSNPEGESFMVYNNHEANRIVGNWFQIFPWIKPYYAIKASPSDMICRGLAAKGAGMDCASKQEIQQALNMGVLPSNIIYSNCVKDQNDLRWAAKNNIALTTADTIDEIKKIKQIAPFMKILWRISVKQNKQDFLASFSEKFGDDFNTKQDIHFRMKQLKNMGIKLQGIHFHSGSGYNGSSGFKKGIQLARSCIEIGRKYNHKMQIMDIGGGFPGGNIPQGVVQSIHITKNDPLGYITIAEPGRHFSSRAFYLFVRVLAKRFKLGQPCYHLNDSVYHSFNCVLVDGVSFSGKDNRFYGKVQKSMKRQLQQTQNGSLFGMTCDGSDIIAQSMMLPKYLSTNDWLCFSGMGSYTYSIKTNFNGMSTTQRFQYWSGNVHKQQQEPIPIRL